MRVPVLALLVVAACGGASMQQIKIVNRSPRPIEELYVYKLGSTDHGASRGSLAPNASTEVKVPAGNVEVMAVSAKYQLDEHTRDRPTASTTLELKAPTEVVFYDEGAAPPGIAGKGTVGVAFTKIPANAAPAPGAATQPEQPEPAPEAEP